jgi:hypothetical protein
MGHQSWKRSGLDTRGAKDPGDRTCALLASSSPIEQRWRQLRQETGKFPKRRVYHPDRGNHIYIATQYIMLPLGQKRWCLKIKVS